jgi:hydrogenase nickel incorporation protein HypA/HybF
MHELSICLALVDQVERLADAHAATGVEQIRLAIGPLSGVESDLLKHAFPLAAAGTRAEHAELVIGTRPVVVRCTVCETESEVASNRLVCGRCGDYRTRLVSGDEMLLEQVTFTTAATAAAGAG